MPEYGFGIIWHRKNLQRRHKNSILEIAEEKSPCGKKFFSPKTVRQGTFAHNITISVDFLVRYLAYQVDDAVLCLCDEPSGTGTVLTSVLTSYDSAPDVSEFTTVELPVPESGPYRRLYAYLLSRGIPAGIIKTLINNNLIYQESEHGNIVFINRERDWGELHGTNSYIPFHGMIKGCREGGFWWIRTSSDASVAYVCEAAIDAISLCLLHQKQGKTGGAYYISIGGAAKQPAIDRIKKYIGTTIIAVDNDEAGQKCRDRNPDCESIVPSHKDWNEDLMSST